MSQEMYTFYCEILAQTDLAVKIFDGADEVWLPKSQVTDEDGEMPLEYYVGEEMTLGVPEWLAEKKGLI